MKNVLALTPAFTVMALTAFGVAAAGEDFARWVDPFIGTVGPGNVFPGACRPFGMVQPSPDTGEKTHCGGYKFTDKTIRHFSQTHLNGTGRPAMGDVGIFPFFSTGLTGLTGLSGGVPPDPRNPVNLVNPVQNKLLTLMVQSMINNDGENPKNCWNAYWENGYIPYCPGEFDKFVPQGQSASTTLELAYDWWCIADFAKCIGDERSAAKAQRWTDCWKNVFDKEIGFVRGRGPMTAGGKWREPFDPRNPRAGGLFWGDFTEANSWIYTWHVFQDVDALADAFGGTSAALAKLDEFFATPPYKPHGKSAKNDEGGVAEASGQIGQYWHGNEPSHHVAYLYSLWGRRDKTAALTRRICREAYLPKPDGLCGNDDCGQMSAWYIFSMMGFYPVNPCGDGYVLGEAQAEKVKLRVGSGEFRILATKNAKDTEVLLNGKVVKGVKISHEDIMRGGTLVFGKDAVR